MRLKEFQERVVREVGQFFRFLAEERDAGRGRYASTEAFRRHVAATTKLGGARYEARETGLGEDLPTVCIKVPTGGGKTLLATQALGSIYRTILKEQNGAGLALWVVPSSQIYRDTLRRLRDRKDLYRVMLEHALHRRIEVWEKHEIARLTKARLAECLNILVVQLASTNRQTKEDLKFFRDSGGNIVQHFPPEDDFDAHRKLKEQIPNLEMIEADEASGRFLCKTSVGNLVRLCKPAVIVDEGHRATSRLARETVEAFNASAVVELSATPHKGANIVSRVGGQELLDEEMIKLPLNIATSGRKDWKDVLTQARDKRKALANTAAEHESATGRHIRPIVLVQVERTGKEQRGVKVGGQRVIHADDVTEHLTQRLDVPATAIAVKTADNDGLEDVDLLDPGCPVEWIITKSALQEGWDCPFAYLLCSLNNTGAVQAMTQLVGRVLRQPDQQRTAYPALNEAYVYCLHQTAGEIARGVKSALEQEGYEDCAGSLVREAVGGSPGGKNVRDARLRPEFSNLYTRPFAGKIYLPRFCLKVNGDEYEPLDYYRHLVARVDVDRFDYQGIDWPLAEKLRDAKDRFYRMTLGDQSAAHVREQDVELVETDGQVAAWLAAALKYDFLSHKQLRRVVARVHERLLEMELPNLRGRLGTVKFVVRDHLDRFIQEQLDIGTERVFNELLNRKKILFYLECRECNFEVPPTIRIERIGPITPLHHNDAKPVENSLFDLVERESANNYEREVALVLDRDANVLWWFRNRVGEGNFSIQGPRKPRIYPDFVVQRRPDAAAFHSVLVVESKGAQLAGNEDTNYKRRVGEYFEKVGHRVSWQQLGQDFKDHVFRFQVLDEAATLGRDWRDELHNLLARSP